MDRITLIMQEQTIEFRIFSLIRLTFTLEC